MKIEARFQKLESLYSKIPVLPCQRRCTEACGVIPLTTIEALRLVPITPPEKVDTVGGFAALHDKQTHSCPHLRNETCSIYQNRPMICRLWGVTPKMPCPFGCKPSRWLTDQEARQLLQEARNLV